MSDFDFVFGFIAGVIGVSITIFLFSVAPHITAEFVCETHGLELIDYEIKNQGFSKVECGNKKPELQYDNYKVFTK